VWWLQESQLHDDEKQEDNDGTSGIQEVLQSLPQAHWPQGNQV